jgi:hypothetical protein
MVYHHCYELARGVIIPKKTNVLKANERMALSHTKHKLSEQWF